MNALPHSRRPALALLGAMLLACLAGRPATTEPLTQPAPASVRVRAARVTDARFARLWKDANVSARSDPGLQVTLQLAGLPELATATGYGHWQIDAATDDRGNDVGPMTVPGAAEEGSKARNQAETYTVIDRQANDELKPGPDGFCDQTFDVQLGIAARGAAVLRRVAGHFDINLGGKEYVARFDHLKGRVGQTLSDAALDSVGVSVKFDRPDPGDGPADPSELKFQLHGDPRLVHDDTLDCVDPDGQSVVKSWDHSGPTSEPNLPYTYQLKRPLDEKMTLIVRVPLGQRTVRVAFDIHHVPLP